MTQKAVWIPKELVSAVAKRCGLTKEKAHEVLTATVDEIRTQAAAEGGLRFRHFGTFYVKHVKSHRYVLRGKTGMTAPRSELAFQPTKYRPQ